MAVGTVFVKKPQEFAVENSVSLEYSVDPSRLASIGGTSYALVGIPTRSGDSGEQVSLNMNAGLVRLQIPASLDPAIGQVLYLDLSAITSAHVPPDAAYTLTASTNYPLLKVTATKDASNFVEGFLNPTGGA